MWSAISLIAQLSRADLQRQRNRLSVAAVAYLAGLSFFTFAVMGAMAAGVVHLATIYGWVASLLIVSGSCALLGLTCFIVNSFYQARQKRHLSRSAAVKAAAMVPAAKLVSKNMSSAALIAAVVGFAIASRVASNTKGD
ncbi:MAG: hypothetical protein AAGG69_00300 [Pseudomonadota bacterium]